ncbi:MAG: hypothetical protein M2R46_01579 [Verrucomicrobia subdivision 3 bacterium]|nr:hypothetical protein [Limisphaerales bacterium]
MLCAEMMKFGAELTSPGHSRRVPPPPRVYRLKTDRPRRTGQGLKLTLAALLTALALLADAAAQNFAISNLTRPKQQTLSITSPVAARFTVGPAPEGITGWTLDKITARIDGAAGNPRGFQAMILNDVSDRPASLDSPLATLTGPDPRTPGRYDFMPPGGTTVFLQPETKYWVAYTSDGLPTSSAFYTMDATRAWSEDDNSLDGWSIDNNSWRQRDDIVNRIMIFGVSVTPVPEPSEYALFFALGLGAFALWHRRRQQRQRAAA